MLSPGSRDLFEEFNITALRPNEAKFPDLSHLENLEKLTPPQFRLVPDCHFLCLFLIGITLSDPHGFDLLIYFRLTRFHPIVDMADPLR
jgi:hypothetical protein